MAKDAFEKCLFIVLGYEGGNDDDPHDPGGRTSRGIVQSEYNKYRDLKRLARRDVWDASDTEVEDIYHTNYWVPLRCEALPNGLDLTAFDGGVNSGIGQEAKWEERSVGLPADGRTTDALVSAMCARNDVVALIDDVLQRRLAMLQYLANWPRYGRGWGGRVANVKKLSEAWSHGESGPVPVAVHAVNGHKKADVSTVTTKPKIDIGHVAIGGTAAGLSATNGHTWAIVCGVGIVVGIVGLSLWEQHKHNTVVNGSAKVPIDINADKGIPAASGSVAHA